MKFKQFFKNIFSVLISNVISLVAGVFLGLLLPKFLSIEDFGWYRTFILYSGYVGFFSLGIVDGIVLKYGNKDYEELDQMAFRSYFYWYVIINGLFVLIMLVSAFVTPDPNMRFIRISLGFYSILINISGYFQQISQITQRFKEFASRKIISSFLRLFNVILLALVSYVGIAPTYNIFLFFLIISETILMGWYFFTYRDIIFGQKMELSQTFKDVLSLSKIGFPLLFANLCTSLILSLDAQIVNMFFKTALFAKYSFAYNLLSLVTIATSAFSVVLYPTLARLKKDDLRKQYQLLSEIVLVLFSIGNFLYFPLSIFIEWYLPKYADSLQFLRIILPGLTLTNLITVLIHNYYKIEGKSAYYFRKSLVVLVLSLIGNLTAYYIFETPIAVSIASIFVILYWYIDLEYLFVKKYSYKRSRNVGYVLINMVAFYIITAFNNHYFGIVLYGLIFTAVTVLFYRKNMTSELSLFQRKLK